MAEARGDQDHHVIEVEDQDHPVIDVEALFGDLKEKLSGDLVFPPRSCIFQIPTILSRHNPDAYKPNAFSFGPFHHHNETLQRTEKIKYKYLLDLTSRLADPNCDQYPNDPDTMLRTLTEEMNKVRKEARAHYAGRIDMNENQFVEVLVLDGCFIIELFRRQAYEKDLKDKNDPVFSMSCLFQFLLNDLILLENQIPWMVLDKLFNLTRTSVDTKLLVQLAIDFFGNIFSTQSTSFAPPVSHPTKHILDLLRNSLVLNSSEFKNIVNQEMVPSEPEPMHSATTLEVSGTQRTHSATTLERTHSATTIERTHSATTIEVSGIQRTHSATTIERTQSATTHEGSEFKRMHSATSLVESGIKFDTDTSKSILDIEFEEGVFKIPQLFIQETTETVFRNLISLEQCCPNYKPAFTSYAVLLDNLINSREDMEILCKSKAIVSWLNIDDATKFFSKLYIDTYVKEYSYYSELTSKVDKYCERFWPRQRRVLMRDYFKHPWAQISVAAASVGLILAFLQTLFSIIK